MAITRRNSSSSGQQSKMRCLGLRRHDFSTAVCHRAALLLWHSCIVGKLQPNRNERSRPKAGFKMSLKKPGWLVLLPLPVSLSTQADGVSENQ
jgi:hypothetical protein